MLESHDRREKQTKMALKFAKNAIINEYLIGMLLTILKELTDTEIALVLDTRLFCQSWIYFAGAPTCKGMAYSLQK